MKNALIIELLLAMGFPVWAAPAPSRGPWPVVVSADDKNDFRTVQAALNNLPANAAQPRTVLIKNGTYREKITIDGKDHLVLKGGSEKRTVLTQSPARDT